MPRGDSGAQRAIKKHDRDDKVQEQVREFANHNFQDWTACEMYGHKFVDGRCDCGEFVDDDDYC
jgi:hypothetical protein